MVDPLGRFLEQVTPYLSAGHVPSPPQPLLQARDCTAHLLSDSVEGSSPGPNRFPYAQLSCYIGTKK